MYNKLDVIPRLLFKVEEVPQLSIPYPSDISVVCLTDIQKRRKLSYTYVYVIESCP